eukprot:2962352-Pleurochrysis_carterae.AAC.1
METPLRRSSSDVCMCISVCISRRAVGEKRESGRSLPLINCDVIVSTAAWSSELSNVIATKERLSCCSVFAAIAARQRARTRALWALCAKSMFKRGRSVA